MEQMRERLDTWSGSDAVVGDMVTVKGERGRFAVQWFEVFGDERRAEVTVVGGLPNRVEWRTFFADKIVRCPEREQRRRKGQ